MDSFTLGEELDAEQRSFLDANGYIRFADFLSREEVEEILAGLQELEAAWISEGREKARGVPIKYGTGADGKRYVNRFAFASAYSPRVHAVVTAPKFERLAKIFGPGF